MFNAVFRTIANRQAHKRAERNRKAEADAQLKRPSLLQCDDAQLAHRLRRVAEKFSNYGYDSAKGFEAAGELHDGLRVLEERVKPGEVDQHPPLAPIVRELATLQSTDMLKTAVLATAVLNGTKENPWRTIARPLGDQAARIEPR